MFGQLQDRFTKIFKTIKGLYPNCFTFYNGRRIKVFEANLSNNKSYCSNDSEYYKNFIYKQLKDYTPGQIIMINKNKKLK